MAVKFNFRVRFRVAVFPMELGRSDPKRPNASVDQMTDLMFWEIRANHYGLQRILERKNEVIGGDIRNEIPELPFVSPIDCLGEEQRPPMHVQMFFDCCIQTARSNPIIIEGQFRRRKWDTIFISNVAWSKKCCRWQSCSY